MSTVDVSVEGVEPPGWLSNFIHFSLSALDALDLRNWEVSVILCGDPFIQNLNRRYRGKDEPTDVLSFPQHEPSDAGSSAAPAVPDRSAAAEAPFYAGDVVISLDTLSENARDFAVDKEEELKRLTIHGLLHLSGMDHSDNSPEQDMLKLQEATLLRLTEERIF